tara:strand:+ start:15354 stop:16772 length:1419 start_codon:yes stop_codon:yes gene_type:complete
MSSVQIIPIILSGGCGSRLWPLSRTALPKQFLALMNERSLLQNTLTRLRYIEGIAAPVVVCAQNSEFLVQEQFKQINCEPMAIIVEPASRNTAPAIALAAQYIAQHHPDAQLLVLPADHDIKDEKLFCREVMFAAEHMKNNTILTFGIKPNRVETNYGYIHAADAHDHLLPVTAFVEKPDFPTAQKYYASDEYYWNSGIFMFSVPAILAELKQHTPKVLKLMSAALTKSDRKGLYLYPDTKTMEKCEDISIDYAVMEKTEHAAMLPINVRWNDLGTWESLMQESTADIDGNVLKGNVIVKDVRNSYVQANNRLIAAVGVENSIIVDAGDTILVLDRSKGHLIKDYVNQLKQQERIEVELPNIVHRPWGTYQTVFEEPHFLVKKITVNPGEQLSLQLHHQRSEHWTAVKGTVTVTVGDKITELKRDESIYIPLEEKHRMANNTDEVVEIVEVQIGDKLEETDIVRLEDNYGRA